jgi:hypothetical protein
MNRYILYPIFTLAVPIVLVFTNQFWSEMQLQRFSRWYWIYVYCGMTVAVSIIAFVIVPTLVKPLQRGHVLAASILGSLITVVLLGLYAYWVGTILDARQSGSLPLRDFNYFFREFRSVVFIFIDAPIFGVLTGLFISFWRKLS